MFFWGVIVLCTVSERLAWVGGWVDWVDSFGEQGE